MPTPMPPVAAVNWYTCRVAAVPPLLATVAGTVTNTVSPGRRLLAGSTVSTLPLAVALPPR